MKDRLRHREPKGTFLTRGGPSVGKSSPGCLRWWLLANEIGVGFEGRFARGDRHARKWRFKRPEPSRCNVSLARPLRPWLRWGGLPETQRNIDRRDQQRYQSSALTRLSYSEAFRKAREKIGPLDKLGIKDSKMRKGVNGGLIIEIMDPENVAKADTLPRSSEKH